MTEWLSSKVENRCVIILVIVFVIGLAAIGWSQNPSPREREADQGGQAETSKNSNSTKPQQRGTEQSPLVVKILLPGDGESGSSAEQNYRGWYATPEWWIVGFTLFLVLVTGALAFYTFRLWSTTNVLTKGSERISKQQLRAYVGAGDVYVKEISQNRLQANIEIVNNGRTPAKEVKKWIVCKIFDVNNPGPFPPDKFERGKGVIVSGGKWVIRAEYCASNSDMMNLKGSAETSNREAFIYGIVEYMDCFGDPQHFKFRYRTHARRSITYSDENNALITVITGWDLYPEEEGNDAT